MVEDDGAGRLQHAGLAHGRRLMAVDGLPPPLLRPGRVFAATRVLRDARRMLGQVPSAFATQAGTTLRGLPTCECRP